MATVVIHSPLSYRTQFGRLEVNVNQGDGMHESSPVAGRLRRPGWKDPRLLVGILLIVVAIVGVSAIVQGADRTVAYYAANATLTPGMVLEEGDLSIAHVRVADGTYLAADATAEPWGQVVTRVIEGGELVPASALASPTDFDGRPVAVVTTSPVAEDIVPGSQVDIWVTAANGQGDPVSSLVGEQLVVAEVVREDGAFSASRAPTVYVVVPSGEIQPLFEALAVDGDVSVVGRGGQA